MEKILIPVVLFLSGCAIPLEKYDLSTSAQFDPISAKTNIADIEVIEFKYEPPHVQISQNTISHMNCLPCTADGSRPGKVFSNKISEIINAEVKNALKEVILESKTTSCKLGATIYLVAWDAGNGDTTIDITYTLIKDENIKYIKRVKETHDNNWINPWAGTPDRLLAQASRKTVSTLLNDVGFNQEVNKNCG